MRTRFIRKRVRFFKRWQKKNTFKRSVLTVLLLAVVFAYAGYMGNQRLTANPASYRALLDLIGWAESNDNYNAYFGNSDNSKINFTKMPIADVMKWQENHVAKGSPSSAVGRYQIINTTLEGLVKELKIDPTQKFDPPTQDKMAIALLERRGAEQYLNADITKEKFAANLAKEWAALPKFTGEDPSRSYYANDGLNRSRVTPEQVIRAIRPIAAQ